MGIKAKILLVDDEIKIINALKRVLNKKEYEILSANTSMDAISILDNNKIDIIICDYSMPDIMGIDVLKYCKKEQPESIRILITGSCDINVAISAINEGNIFHYFSKPWKNEEILSVVKKSVEYKFEQEEKLLLYNFMEYSRKHTINELDKISSGTSKDMELMNENKLEKILKKISVWEDEDIILLDMIDIVYLSVDNGDVFIFTHNKKYKTKDPLNVWENKLNNNNFFRCHRSYIVNIDKIEKISPWFSGTYNLNLKKMQETIPVSRNYFKKLKSILDF